MAVATWRILTLGETSPKAQDALAQQVTRMQQNTAQPMRMLIRGSRTRQIAADRVNVPGRAG